MSDRATLVVAMTVGGVVGLVTGMATTCVSTSSAIQMEGYRTLEEGQQVEFDVGPGKNGEEAQNVRLV